MAYSTPAMVRKALALTSDGSLPATPTNTAADLPDEQLTDAIAEADSEIDSYLGNFYAVPVAANPDGSVPGPLSFWSRNIAAYNATMTFRGSLDFPDTDPVARRYKDTLAALQKVAAGQIKLQLPDNATGNAAASAGAPYNPYVGDLWTPDDFDLTTDPVPGQEAWTGGTPFWWDFW